MPTRVLITGGAGFIESHLADKLLQGAMGAAVGRQTILPQITAKYRMGDVRHCFADISQAMTALGYMPRHDFARGLSDLVKWLDGKLPPDRTLDARAELDARGLTI